MPFMFRKGRYAVFLVTEAFALLYRQFYFRFAYFTTSTGFVLVDPQDVKQPGRLTV